MLLSFVHVSTAQQEDRLPYSPEIWYNGGTLASSEKRHHGRSHKAETRQTKEAPTAEGKTIVESTTTRERTHGPFFARPVYNV